MKNEITPLALALALAAAAGLAVAGLARPAAASPVPNAPAAARPSFAEPGEKGEMDEKDEHGDMEKSMKLADAPAAVKTAVEKEIAGGGKLKKLSKESEDGKTVYEAEITKDGKEMSVNMAEDGTVMERETKIKHKDLPDGAMKAIKAKYPKAKVGTAEKVEKDGKTTFEVAVTPDGADEPREVTLDADGKIVKDEEAD